MPKRTAANGGAGAGRPEYVLVWNRPAQNMVELWEIAGLGVELRELAAEVRRLSKPLQVTELRKLHEDMGGSRWDPKTKKGYIDSIELGIVSRSKRFIDKTQPVLSMAQALKEYRAGKR